MHSKRNDDEFYYVNLNINVDKEITAYGEYYRAYFGDQPEDKVYARSPEKAVKFLLDKESKNVFRVYSE